MVNSSAILNTSVLIVDDLDADVELLDRLISMQNIIEGNSYLQTGCVKYISYFISLQKGFEVVPFAGVPVDR